MRLLTRQLLLSLLLLLPLQPSVAGTFSQIGTERWVTVAHVYDGDTFRTDKGEKIRLLGINTPEIAHNDKPGEEMGQAARRLLKSLILGKRVQLEFDQERKDSYGRTLAHVYLRDGSWINGRMIAEGMAHLYLFAPNFKHAEALQRLEQDTRSRHAGIWRTSRFRVLGAAECDASLAGQFRLVSGSVTSTDRNGWGFRLGTLSVSIPKAYRQWFKTAPAPAMHQRLIVHGTLRLSGSGRLFLALHSPFDLEIVK